ncbi:hypothetical protein QJQ45_014340 [Haematococcus lacustris]|nr:hypothetical protein QJQ45_014340 [Haematococcus lacustris]
MQRIGESRWRPLELCWWPDQAALPAKGKEYPGLGYKRAQLMTKTPRCTGKGHSIKCAALWCTVSCLFGILASIVGPTATILAEQTHSTEADLAPMLGMGGICTLLTGLPSGWIFDFMPRQGNRLVAATLLVEAAAYTLMTLCTSVLELTVVYAVIGLVFNVVSTGLNVMVIWEFTTHAPQHLPLVLNLLSASFGLGGIIAPQLVNLASIASPAGGVAAYYAVSTAAAVMAVAVGVTRSPTPPGSHIALAQSEGQHKEQRTEEQQQQQQQQCVKQQQPYLQQGQDAEQHGVEQSFQQHDGMEEAQEQQGLLQGLVTAEHEAMGQVTGGEGPAGEHVVDAGLRREGWVAAEERWGVLLPALLVLFANVSIELGYAGWVYVYARDVGGVSDYAAESLCSVYWMAFTGGRLLAAVLVTIIPCGTVLLWSMPLAVVGAAWPLLAPGPTATIASVLLVGLGASAGFPTTLGMTAECIPLDGHLNGLISTVTGLSITLLPSAIPFMAKRDPQRGFAWLMIATLAMALMQYVCLVQLVCASKGIKRRAAIAAAAAAGSSPGEEDPEAPRSVHATHVVDDEALTTPLLSGA